MSEVIVRMELPKQCIDCCVRSECDLYMNELKKPFEKRDFTAFKPLGKGCLIRGVLPEQHGRLVDERELFARCRPVKNFDNPDALVIVKGAVIQSQTIVPATEGENK